MSGAVGKFICSFSCFKLFLSVSISRGSLKFRLILFYSLSLCRLTARWFRVVTLVNKSLAVRSVSRVAKSLLLGLGPSRCTTLLPQVLGLLREF